MRRRLPALLPLLAALVLVACASPEAMRVRAGGPGADVDNRTPVVNMHQGADPFWKTPVMIPTQGPVDAARHADRLSR